MTASKRHRLRWMAAGALLVAAVEVALALRDVGEITVPRAAR